MLDLEAFVFIRAHNRDGKNQGDEVGAGKQKCGLRTKTLRFFKN